MRPPSFKIEQALALVYTVLHTSDTSGDTGHGAWASGSGPTRRPGRAGAAAFMLTHDPALRANRSGHRVTESASGSAALPVDHGRPPTGPPPGRRPAPPPPPHKNIRPPSRGGAGPARPAGRLDVVVADEGPEGPGPAQSAEDGRVAPQRLLHLPRV